MNWGVKLGCRCKWGGQRKLHKETDMRRILKKKENHIGWLARIASPTKILSQECVWLE